MKINLYRSDWIGIVLGILLGAYQPFSIMDTPIGKNLDLEIIPFFVVFGLFAPPILAFITKVLPIIFRSIYEKVGLYINFIFLIVAFGITTGIVGFAYHLIFGVPERALALFSLFWFERSWVLASLLRQS